MLHAILFQILAATSGTPMVGVTRDSAGLTLTTQESGFAVVLASDTLGNVRVLFPSAPSENGWMLGGERRHIDDAADPGPHIYAAAYATTPFVFFRYALEDKWVATGLAIRESDDLASALAAEINAMNAAPEYYLFVGLDSRLERKRRYAVGKSAARLAAASRMPLISVATDASVYTPGQAARVTVTAARDGYLLLFAVDQAGVVRVIFPTHPTDNAWIPGGVPIDIVRGDDQRTLDIDGPFGTAMLFAAISRTPYKLYDFRNGNEWIPAAINDSLMPIDAERGLTALAQRMNASYVAHATTTYEVVPASTRLGATSPSLTGALAARARTPVRAPLAHRLAAATTPSFFERIDCPDYVDPQDAVFGYSSCPTFSPNYLVQYGFPDNCTSPPFEILPWCAPLSLGNTTMLPKYPPPTWIGSPPPHPTPVHLATGPAGGNHPIIGAHPPITTPHLATPALNVRGREPTPAANSAGSQLAARAPSWSTSDGSQEPSKVRSNVYASGGPDRGGSGGGSSGGNSRDGGSRANNSGGGGGSYQDGNGSDRGSSSGGGGYSGGGSSGGGSSGGGGYSAPEPSPTGTFGGGYGGPAGSYGGASNAANEPRNEPASGGNSAPAAGRPPR